MSTWLTADHNKGETTQLNHFNIFIKSRALSYKETKDQCKWWLSMCSVIWTVALRMYKLTRNN